MHDKSVVLKICWLHYKEITVDSPHTHNYDMRHFSSQVRLVPNAKANRFHQRGICLRNHTDRDCQKPELHENVRSSHGRF